MRFGIVYRHHLHRAKTQTIDAESLSALKTMKIGIDPERFNVEWVIDFDERKMIHVALDSDGILHEVPEGQWGALTKMEHFKEEHPDFFEEGESDDSI